MADGSNVSMDNGVSTSMDNSKIARSINGVWSMPATPMFTSRMSAPASTWSNASRFTRMKEPSRNSWAKTLRPVGLIRSPMISGFVL